MSFDDHVIDHFTQRAGHYNKSSKWVTDQALGNLLLRLTEPTAADRMLDVACGTGLVSRVFAGKVGHLVGLDITPAMFAQAEEVLDEMVVASAEQMPFEDNSFDLVVERQGIQFTDDTRSVSEMVRVTRPGGRVCLVQLCAYNDDDRDEYFEVLRLRNPARKNFYQREDLAQRLLSAGCSDVAIHDYISVEDVDAWSDNKAIPEAWREGIRAIYRNATPAFAELHAVSSEDGNRFEDHMLFAVAIGRV